MSYQTRVFPRDLKVGDIIVEAGRPDELVTDIVPPGPGGTVWELRVTFKGFGGRTTEAPHYVGSRAALTVTRG